MNLHPIFVHFPIALFTLYCLFELLRFKRLRENDTWFYLKLSLLVIGTAFGFVALQTGDIAKHLLESARGNPLVSLHEFWAQFTVSFFGFLSACYLIAWAKKYDLRRITERNNFIKKCWSVLLWIEHLMIETPLAVLLAVLGFLALVITGALGGSIVYGTNADIFTKFVVRLLLGY